MKDLSNPFGIKPKAISFLVIVATVLIVLDNPEWQTALLLALAIWSFAGFAISHFTSSRNAWIRNASFPGWPVFRVDVIRALPVAKAAVILTFTGATATLPAWTHCTHRGGLNISSRPSRN
jgi:hypothetical protein